MSHRRRKTQGPLIACACKCGEFVYSIDLNYRHHQFVRGHNTRKPILERFWAKIIIDEATGCWLWQGGKVRGGYGEIWHDGKILSAHRWSYEHYVGPIPDGLHLDHIVCDTPACVNPLHTKPSTVFENTRRSSLYWANRPKYNAA